MAMNDAQAESAAKELILALAQSGALPVIGNTGNALVDRATNRAHADASYITTLYQELVSGFQK